MKMNFALTSTIAALLLGTSTAVANQTFLEPEMSIFISDLETSGQVERVEYPDLDADGMSEALINMKTPFVEGGESSEWRIVKMVDGEPKSIFSWAGDDVYVQKTFDLDAISPTPDVINSDGSVWGYITGAMRPYNDLVTQRADFFHPGTQADIDLFEDLFEAHGLQVDQPSHIQKVRLEIQPGLYVTLLSLRGDGYWREQDGASPYLILSVKGEPIRAGMSFLPPSIYTMENGHLYLIDNVNFGYAGSSVSEEEYR